MRSAMGWLIGASLLFCVGAAAAYDDDEEDEDGEFWKDKKDEKDEKDEAPKIDNIGNSGQLVLGVDRVMGVAIEKQEIETEYDVPGGTTTDTEKSKTSSYSILGVDGETSYALHPRVAFDYFVAQGFSLGASVVYIHRGGTVETSTEGGGADNQGEVDLDWDGILISPRLGVGIQFDETGALWPRVGVTYVSGAGDWDGVESIDQLSLTGELMLVISPMTHFAILLGPYIEYGLTGTMEMQNNAGDTQDWDVKSLSFGGAASLVGYY